jgi:2-keto-4-pentenoate hydratase
MAIMSDGIVAEVADRLWQAEISRSPISPITEAHPELGVEDAYAIQSRNIERRIGTGRVIRGRKVGLTAKPMQDLFGVREPDFGVLLDDMFVEDGDEIALEDLLQPRVEAEMAFLIGRDLAGPGLDVRTGYQAQRMVVQHRLDHLEPGSVVLSGGLTAPLPMGPRSVVPAEFDGLGTVDVYS